RRALYDKGREAGYPSTCHLFVARSAFRALPCSPVALPLRRTHLAAAFSSAALVAIAVVTGCQTYDFEPVDPVVISQSTQIDQIVARARKPNVMLLVDTSASMRLPIDPTLPACQYGDAGVCGEPGHAGCDPATCPSRWSELESSMGGFLADAGTLARYG